MPTDNPGLEPAAPVPHPKPPSTRAQLATQVALRRRVVARMLLARATQQEIATHLGVSQPTINADIQALREEWAAEAQASIYELITQECRALDADEALWRAQLREALSTDVALALKIYDRIGPIIERRMRLRGLNNPPKPGDRFRDEVDNVLESLGLGPDGAWANR